LVILLALNIKAHRFSAACPVGSQPHSGIGDPNSGSGTNGEASVGPQPTNGNLKYFGGPMITNIKVVGVFMRRSTTTTTTSKTTKQTTTTTTIAEVAYTDKLPSFYNDLAKSSVMDFLTSYSQSTETIGYGSYLGSINYTWNGSTTISDKPQIQNNFLDNIIPIALKLFPGLDFSETLFMHHMAPGFTINLGTYQSCKNWCGYHSTVIYPPSSSGYAYYGVIPDLSANQGCNNNCNCANLGFCNKTDPKDYWSATTVISSHEFCEAVTDPCVGIYNGYQYPMGWINNSTGNEIGDLCLQNPVQLQTNTGNTYIVQKEFSNAGNVCYPASPLTIWPN